MKKFLKICLAASAVLILIGMILTVIGRVAGGQRQLNSLAGRELLRLGSVSEDWEYSMDFDGRHKAFTEDFTEVIPASTAEEIIGLDVDLAGTAFYIRESTDGTVSITGYDISKAQYYVEDGILYIKAQDRRGWDQEGGSSSEICLYFPMDKELEEAKIELGAGKAEMDFLNAETLECSVGAGELYFTSLKAAEAELEVGMGNMQIWRGELGDMQFSIGMGNLDFSGSISGDLDGECGMGSVVMELSGDAKEHNYDVEASMGTVKINGNSFTGMAAEKLIDNGANSDFTLTSSMGTVEIYFTNEEM